MSIIDVVDPMAGYRVSGPDELRSADGSLHPHWRGLADAYARFGLGELHRRDDEIRRLLEQDGVTYNTATSDGRRVLRPWALDPVPLILPAAEWRTIEAGVRQRAELLDAILRDLYGTRRLLSTRLIPPEAILSDPQFVRVCDRIEIPGPRQLVVAAADLARDADGNWRCLGDRTQAPSGAAFALENRRVISRVFPVVHRESQVARLAPYVRALRAALRAAAPVGVDDPAIVVLSPGARSETAFEHASIAAMLGLPLVQGSDLEVRDGSIWLRTVDDVAPVHVILRRVDAWFCDPLELRPDSTLGVAGLVDACRAGTVSVVNTLGSGVLENAGLASRLALLCRHLLGEELALAPAETWWCGDAAGRSHVLANLGQLIVRPLSRLGLEHSVDTSRLDSRALAALSRRIDHEPHRWAGQERVEPATVPVLGEVGLESRPTVVRTFAVAGADSYVVMAGGLARARGDRPDASISGRAGAVAKDLWVLADEPESDDAYWLADSTQTVRAAPDVLSARAAENFFWLGRYAERAESTARLLRVVFARRDEFDNAMPGPGPAALTVLLTTTTRATGTYPGFVGDDAETLLAGPDEELFSLVVDQDRPGSLAHALSHMLDGIDELRDQLSIDTALALASVQRRIDHLADGGWVPVASDATDETRAVAEIAETPEVADTGLGGEDRDEAVSAMLAELVAGLLALGGLVDTSMVRDQGWHYLDAGRRIERALQVTELLAATLTDERAAAVDSLLIESVLVAAESIITYRRRYRSRAQAAAVLELLLIDPKNPRSVAFQLPHVLADLAELHGDDATPAAVEASQAIAAAIGALAAADLRTLAEVDEFGHRPTLGALTALLRSRLRDAARAIERAAFVRQLPQRSMLVPAETPTPTHRRIDPAEAQRP